MAAARVMRITYVLAIATDADSELLKQSLEVQGPDSVKMVLVQSCVAGLRYLKQLDDAQEVWVFPDAFGNRQQQFFLRSVEIRRRKVKVLFIHETDHPLAHKLENIDWWIPTKPLR